MRRSIGVGLLPVALAWPLDATILMSSASAEPVVTDFSAQRHGGGHRPGGAHRPPAHRPPGAHRPPSRPPGAHRPPGVHRPLVRPHHPWVRPPRYSWRPGGAIAAGAALGFVAAATAAAWAGQPPAPGLCWYYTDFTRTQGFWDRCP